MKGLEKRTIKRREKLFQNSPGKVVQRKTVAPTQGKEKKTPKKQLMASDSESENEQDSSEEEWVPLRNKMIKLCMDSDMEGIREESPQNVETTAKETPKPSPSTDKRNGKNDILTFIKVGEFVIINVPKENSKTTVSFVAIIKDKKGKNKDLAYQVQFLKPVSTKNKTNLELIPDDIHWVLANDISQIRLP